MLDLAKVEAGKQEVHVEPARLDAVVDRVRRVFVPLAEEKGLRLVVAIAEGLPETITTDAPRLGQILTNLVGNAIKFTDRGVVELRVQRPEAGVKLRSGRLGERRRSPLRSRIRGPSIATEHQERIFAPFEQLEDSAHRRQGGTGLGLSIARELTALLGGELQLRSVNGEGSTFVCYLPEKTSLPDAPAVALAEAAESGDGAAHRRSPVGRRHPVD